ncbi:hypothetical protein B0H11DRAFT_2263117 [Mycena galericulata]|nr:hypothetical protein B0H11DRAFT_2263117 [Mycena galericulata]
MEGLAEGEMLWSTRGEMQIFIADTINFVLPLSGVLRTREYRLFVTSAVVAESGRHLFTLGKEGSQDAEAGTWVEGFVGQAEVGYTDLISVRFISFRLYSPYIALIQFRRRVAFRKGTH